VCARSGYRSDIPAGTTVPAIFSTRAALAFIRRQWRRVDAGEGVSLAISDARSDEAVGLMWLAVRPQPGVVGLGYWVIPRARRRGIGSRAARLASRWALEDAGMARVEAWAQSDNLASQRLLASAGFTREGVLRAFLEVDGVREDAIVFSRTGRDA
jgi:ribosomal-protein-alanine N-acetyltransferase